MSQKINRCPTCKKALIYIGDATTNRAWLKCTACLISSPAETFVALCNKIKVAENALAVVPDGYQITKFELEEMCDDTQREWRQVIAEIEPIPLTMESVMLRCKKGLELARDTYEYSPDPQLLIDIDTVVLENKNV